MKHIGCFSGGKDSTALMLWMKENIGVPGQDWTPVFCDTGWEHPITYAYVEEINQQILNGSIVRLFSEKYMIDKPQDVRGFVQLCIDRKSVPSVKRRFCTQELKVIPLHAYYESLDDEITSYQGIRADESASRAAMAETQWVDDAGGYWINRPLLRWTAERCFDLMKLKGVKPNPLYLMGSSRVGCWPCIMTGLGELKRILAYSPELRDRLIDLERIVNEKVANRETRKWPATFFAAGTIPPRFCSIRQLTDICECGHRVHSGEICSALADEDIPEQICQCANSRARMAYVPTAEDVFRYIESVDENQLPLLPARSCMSVYNLCE